MDVEREVEEVAIGAEPELLPDTVPVIMPDLPPTLPITTLAQFKAFSDPVRSRILTIILNEPVTAKQLATRLGATPGAIGHHLHVLEEAGLAKVVARRLVRGIVAKYYTRTARLFQFDIPREVTGPYSVVVDLLTRARDELAETVTSGTPVAAYETVTFAHVRLSKQRAAEYEVRFATMLEELLHEPPDGEGDIYGIALALFESPPYLQRAANPAEPA